jgi:nitrate/nitrite-specific signal transduction histidine kinase
MLTLGTLVALLLATALSAIVLLTDVLNDLNRLSSVALQRAAATAAIGTTLTTIEGRLNALRLNPTMPLDPLLEDAERLSGQVHELTMLADPELRRGSGWRLEELLPELRQRIQRLAVIRDPAVATERASQALEIAFGMREAIAAMSQVALDRTDEVQRRVTTKFRWMLLGLGVAFMVVINVSIMVLLRAAAMILRPVDQLVEASRRLAREEFDHRVHIDQKDESGELAEASNALAEQLQLNEQRKIETLKQVATTLNHELNNAISVIDLQLEMVARTSGGDPAHEQRLRQINDALRRMRDTVEALKRVRRIVLTDYIEGVKMLDLERSVETDVPAAAR